MRRTFQDALVFGSSVSSLIGSCAQSPKSPTSKVLTMGCTDSKPVAKPAKASKTEKAPKKAPVAAPVPTEPVHSGPVPTEPEPVQAAEPEPVQAAEPAEAAEAGELNSTNPPAEAPPVTDDGEGQTSAGAAAVAAVDLELEAELPVIPEGSLGMKAEGLEESETTAEPKDEESPRLFGRLKVEAAPDVARGPCVCTNFW